MTEKPMPHLYLEPAQSRVAYKKFVDLMASGYESCGVMIRRKTGDTVEYGAISSGGLVIWWQPVPTQQAPVAQQPQCWCTTCRPITASDMRFVVCPDCGNKRCPRAHNHTLACTESNEPGQPGSSWEHAKPALAVINSHDRQQREKQK